ncbi:hypothetical protein EDF77_1911 [Stenotrophomonas maltophilia]|uniref:hypothetical protein n=1 Tax=Stenotrophomonas chelatiphaga TaxID=517011 RepID=UPI000F4CB928|nr:hypothetical protein [Stenotrophomonas chelatiphaga]MCS4231377.1 hypothetical protein [Stenotrophomonas chelatiphaga]ROQ42437.1 hypothetical protein EDF77_1911 [Stenotrophomonas maltophilia]
MKDLFWLRREMIGPQVMVSIDANRYTALCQARATFVDAGAFEQRYEILLGNHLGLEQFCAEWSMRRIVEMDHRYETGARIIVEANRHVMNLLSAARAYADHVVRDFGHLALSPPFQAQAEALMREEYDRSLSYRIVCALRNYVQHRSTPVHGLSGRKSPSWADRMAVYCHKKKLIEEGKFKASVLAEMEDETDLKIVAREYMRGVSSVHIELRKRVSEQCHEARRLHEEAINEFVAAQAEPEEGTPGIGLTVCREVGGHYVDKHPILLEWDNVRLLLAKKNRFAFEL